MLKRLIKKSEFIDGFMDYDDSMISIFENPTASEIETTSSENGYGAIRGLIYSDGTEYCWSGSILHDDKQIKSRLNINEFRFAFEEDIWIFDLHLSISFFEGMEQIVKYKDILSKYGNINAEINLYYANTNASEEFKNVIDIMHELDVEFDSSNLISFKSYNILEKSYNKLLNSSLLNGDNELEQTGKRLNK